MYITGMWANIEAFNILVYGKIKSKVNQGISHMTYAMKILFCIYSKWADINAHHAIVTA